MLDQAAAIVLSGVWLVWGAAALVLCVHVRNSWWMYVQFVFVRCNH